MNSTKTTHIDISYLLNCIKVTPAVSKKILTPATVWLELNKRKWIGIYIYMFVIELSKPIKAARHDDVLIRKYFASSEATYYMYPSNWFHKIAIRYNEILNYKHILTSIHSNELTATSFCRLCGIEKAMVSETQAKISLESMNNSWHQRWCNDNNRQGYCRNITAYRISYKIFTIFLKICFALLYWKILLDSHRL